MIRRRRRRLAALLLVLLLPATAAAHERAAPLSLDGDAVQGGLIVGHTAPGARVAVDGRPVRVSADGLFLVGLGRDAAATRIAVETTDGARTVRTLAVAGRTYPEQRIDGLPERQVTPTPEDLRRIRAETAALRAARRRDSGLLGFRDGFVWPVVGPLSGVYGSRRILNGEPRAPHLGVDVAAPEGTPVLAPAGGVVALVHPGMFFTGRTVMLDHGHGLTSVYAHMSEILVEEGERVRQGRPIGRVGASGRVTGAHLHWGVHWLGVGLDPALLAGAMPEAAAPR